MRTYFLRYKRDVIGTFQEEDGRISYLAVLETAMGVPGGFGFPLDLFPLYPAKHELNHVRDYHPTKKDIDLWLSNRILPPDRMKADHLLQSMSLHLGLDIYNLWDIAKRTNAVSNEDYYWMSASLEDQYELMHPRYKQDTLQRVQLIIEVYDKNQTDFLKDYGEIIHVTKLRNLVVLGVEVDFNLLNEIEENPNVVSVRKANIYHLSCVNNLEQAHLVMSNSE
jgi:uncharacterized protein YlbG (UPF0298 family)